MIFIYCIQINSKRISKSKRKCIDIIQIRHPYAIHYSLQLFEYNRLVFRLKFNRPRSNSDDLTKLEVNHYIEHKD